MDHAVVLVEDLSVASRDFAALGFTVVPGGEHEKLGTHNSLIAFEDGSYLELIAFRKEAQPSARPSERVLHWKAAGRGLVDFAVVPEGRIEEGIEAAARRGLAILGPLPGGRLRPDGLSVSWQFGFPDGFDLPFICADVTPRARRVPGGEARRHRNGAAGIAAITVGVADLGASAARYRAFLGIEPRPGLRPAAAGGPGLEFVLGTASIRLEPAEGGPEPGRPREGPRAVELLGGGAAGRGRLDPTLTHGARIEIPD